MKETVFYIVGIALAISAVVVSFIGLKAEKFPGKMSVVVILVFAVGAVGAGTFAVLYSKEHAEHREHELEHANEMIEAEEHGEPDEEAVEDDLQKEDGEGAEPQEGTEGHEDASEEEAAGGKEAGGAGGTLEVIANESALEYEEESLETEAGEVEIDFDNPSAIGHDVKIEKDGKDLGGTEVIVQSEESATVELKPGDYVFYCSVPGHREAGMEGPLTVK
jgi:plastocyanin